MKTSELIREIKNVVAVHGQFWANPEHAASILAALERGEKMREALEPFAKFGASLMNGRGKVPKSGVVYGLDCGCPTEANMEIEHFKAAKEALAGGDS
jgi:hypothetical protein